MISMRDKPGDRAAAATIRRLPAQDRQQAGLDKAVASYRTPRRLRRGKESRCNGTAPPGVCTTRTHTDGSYPAVRVSPCQSVSVRVPPTLALHPPYSGWRHSNCKNRRAPPRFSTRLRNPRQSRRSYPPRCSTASRGMTCRDSPASARAIRAASSSPRPPETAWHTRRGRG